MSNPFPEPVKQTDEKMYERRTSKGMFINPPGSEHAQCVHSFGRAHLQDTKWPPGSRERGEARTSEEFSTMRKRRGMEGESLAMKGPLK